MSEPAAYEDLGVGLRWSCGRRTVTEADVDAFARVSGDAHPLHTDPVYAASTGFGERIAHGALVLAITTGLRQQEGRFRDTLKAWAGIREWRFLAPVFFGDTIAVECEVVERRGTSDPGAGLVVQRVEVANQRAELVACGEFVSLIHRRAA